MTAKEYLSELQAMKVKIEQLQEQRQMYLEMATSITAAVNPVRVQTSGTADRVGDNAAKAADLEKMIDDKTSHFFTRQNEIMYQIQSLHNVEFMQVLFKVYIREKTVKEAAVEMKRSYPYVLKIHKKALAAFEEKYADILAI